MDKQRDLCRETDREIFYFIFNQKIDTDSHTERWRNSDKVVDGKDTHRESERERSQENTVQTEEIHTLQSDTSL